MPGKYNTAFIFSIMMQTELTAEMLCTVYCLKHVNTQISHVTIN